MHESGISTEAMLWVVADRGGDNNGAAHLNIDHARLVRDALTAWLVDVGAEPGFDALPDGSRARVDTVIDEPGDGTRLAVLFADHLNKPHDRRWLVIWRDDERGDIAYRRPDPDDAGEGYWFDSDGEGGFMWTEIVDHIVEAYTLTRYEDGTRDR